MFATLISVEAVLAGLQACGLDAARIRSGLTLPVHGDTTELVSYKTLCAVWTAARAEDPRPDLPVRVGLGVPFGVYGTIDYLVGSAETINGGLQSLVDHFSVASAVRELELKHAGDGNHLRVINKAAADLEMDEFAVSVILGRLRLATHGQFDVQRVHLTRPPVAGAPHAEALKVPVTYGAAHAGFDYGIEQGELPPSSKDPRLHATLLELTAKLGLKSDKTSGFEVSVRARLRNLLPRAQGTAERVARSMGISERTLTRRLSESGTTYHEVLDKFRSEESERLLLQGNLELSEIALTLGFSDQATWSRSFRRAHSTSPAAWLSAQRSAS